MFKGFGEKKLGAMSTDDIIALMRKEGYDDEEIPNTKDEMIMEILFAKEISKPKKERISKNIRESVWEIYMGKVYEGKCFTGCGANITIKNFQCGHVKAEALGGKATAENLRPICQSCNMSMGKMDLNEFSKRFKVKPKYTIEKNIMMIDISRISSEVLLKIKDLLDMKSEPSVTKKAPIKPSSDMKVINPISDIIETPKMSNSTIDTNKMVISISMPENTKVINSTTSNIRCCEITKSGEACKNNGKLSSNGKYYCAIHIKNIE